MLHDDPPRVGLDGRGTIALHLAVEKRNLTTLDWLLAHGVAVDASRSLRDSQSHGAPHDGPAQ
jgi:hypothetical protein